MLANLLKEKVGKIIKVEKPDGFLIHGRLVDHGNGIYSVAGVCFEGEAVDRIIDGYMTLEESQSLEAAADELARLAEEAKMFDPALEKWLNWMAGEHTRTRIGVTACLQAIKRIAS